MCAPGYRTGYQRLENLGFLSDGSVTCSIPFNFYFGFWFSHKVHLPFFGHFISICHLYMSGMQLRVDLRTETKRRLFTRDWTTCSNKLIILGSVPNTNVTQSRFFFCNSSPHHLLIPFNVIIIHFTFWLIFPHKLNVSCSIYILIGHLYLSGVLLSVD